MHLRTNVNILEEIFGHLGRFCNRLDSSKKSFAFNSIIEPQLNYLRFLWVAWCGITNKLINYVDRVIPETIILYDQVINFKTTEVYS